MRYEDMTNGQILSLALVNLAQLSLEAVYHASTAHNGDVRNSWIDDAIAMTQGMEKILKALNLPSEHMEQDFWNWVEDAEDAIWTAAGE